MKTPRIFIVIGLVMILAIGVLGCGPSGGSGITPTAGYWASTNFGTTSTGVEFYVSSNGKSITATGSPIIWSNPLAITGYIDFGDYAVGTSATVSISQSKFSYNGYWFDVSGTFSDTTHCSGTFTIDDDDWGVHESFNWSATPQTYSPSFSSKSFLNKRVE